MAWVSILNERLTQEQKENNAAEIWNILGTRGWTVNAVAGILGDMQAESTINPNVWEGFVTRPEDTNLGFGLVQWTPASKIRDWLRENGYSVDSGDGQVQRLILEMENGLGGQYFINKNKLYPITRTEFIKSTLDASTLASAFMYNYERPSAEAIRLSESNRRKWATEWYGYLTGTEPIPPEPPPTPSPSASNGTFRVWTMTMHSSKRLNGKNKKNWFR